MNLTLVDEKSKKKLRSEEEIIISCSNRSSQKFKKKDWR